MGGSMRQGPGACAVANSFSAGAPRGWAARPGRRRKPPGRVLVHGVLPEAASARHAWRVPRLGWRRAPRRHVLVHGLLPALAATQPERRVTQAMRCCPRRRRTLVHGVLPQGSGARCPPHPAPLRGRRLARLRGFVDFERVRSLFINELAEKVATGAKVWVTPHFFLASIRQRRLFASCA